MHRFGRLVTLLFVSALAAGPVSAQIYADASLSTDANSELVNDADIFAPPPVAFAPPALPVYDVPPPPAEEMVWQPGFWRWDGYGYFWVPGTWVEAPMTGLLWTPGYWGWNGYAYEWHEGYWAENVGYYGGICYGGGYDGNRFYGGSWVRGRYENNPSIWNRHEAHANYVSFNGGPGGIVAAITVGQARAEHQHHYEMTREQREHSQNAAHTPQFRSASNHGRPPVAATARPGDFTHGVGASQAGPVNVAARQHNAQVRQNPSLAHEAAMPQTRIAQPVRMQPQARAAASVAEPTVTRVNSPMMVTTEPEARAPEVEHTPREVNTRIAKVPAMPQAVREPMVAPQPQAQPRQEMPHPVQTQPRHVEQPHAQPQQQHHEEPHREERHENAGAPNH
jgi:hypothetical protein